MATNELYTRIANGSPWILLVDDDPNILDTAKDILEEHGYKIHTAGDGAAAIKQLDEKEFNVVVVDFQLPDATGLELARKIRERNEHTCVILMTGHASLEMAVKAIQEAIYDYLIKPVAPDQLHKTIEKALEKQRLSLENRQLVAELKEANEAMARLDLLKSKMLTVMSHDLRTPLSSIRGYSELLKSGVKGKLTEAQKRMVDITVQEADHLNGLIGDLLDLASIEAGKLSIDTRPVPFKDLVNKALPRVKLVSELKEIPIDIALSEPLPTVMVDTARMVQVLCNLLRGALKHATRGSRVYLNVAEKGDKIETKITHSGPGFTPEQLKTLFAVNGNNQEHGGGAQDGLRISLAIAREIINAHGGEIGIESNSGQGSTFWIRLPVAKDVPAETSL